MTSGLRRYEFSERLADILGESRRDLRARVTLMIAGGIVPPGSRGPGSPPATADYAADLLIGVMAAPRQADTAEAVRRYRDLRPTALAAEATVPAVALGAAAGAGGGGEEAAPELPLLPGRPRFGEAVALLLELARDEGTRGLVAEGLFGLWVGRGFPVAAVQLAAWSDGRRAVVNQRYEPAGDARPPSWLDPDRGGAADPGLFHSVFLPAAKLAEIGALTAPQDERRARVTGLGQTIADLARHRPQMEKFLAAAAAGGPMPGAARPAGRLVEVAGFGPNPGNLRMLAHVPDHLPPSAPLVVALHGCTQSAAAYDHGTGWSRLADRHGFALLCPEQKRENNPNGCFTWFEPGDTRRGGGEPASIRQMVERMIVDHGLDRRRVYVTGLSAGGAMTSVMLATYPDVFAGGAIIAGLPYGCASSVQEAFDCMFQGRARPARAWGDLVRAASPHRGPWPKVSVWHGGADATVVPANAAEIVKQWTDVHGIGGGAAPAVEETVDGQRRRAWRGAGGEDLVEAYGIAGMAHGVPIGAGGGERIGAAGPFVLDVGISSTWHVARFWGLTGQARAAAAEAPPTAGPATPPPTTTRAVVPAGPVRQHAREEAPRPAEPTARAVDPQSIITRALEAAGLMRPAREADPQGLPLTGTGWEGEGWRTLAGEDGRGAPGGPVLFGYASSGVGCDGGEKVRSASRRLTLGARPLLSYSRRLELSAAVNIFTRAAFRVLVDGVPVDDVSVVGMDYAEAGWTERAGIDLAAFAGREVTLTFEARANSNVCLEVLAKAWIAEVAVRDAAVTGG